MLILPKKLPGLITRDKNQVVIQLTTRKITIYGEMAPRRPILLANARYNV